MEKAPIENPPAMGSPPTPQQPEKIDWNGVDDPGNPQNWTLWRKWATLLGVSGFCLLTMLSSTMIAPATPTIQAELSISSELVMECALSVYFLGMGIGPLVLSPTSEALGRYPVLIVGNIFYLVWNTVCGFATDQATLIAFRFLTGVGASTPMAVAGGIIGDLWSPESRGQVLAVYTCVPLLGPAIGPIVGGFVSQSISWRWIFWCFSIVDTVVLLLVLCLARESYAPRLLYLKGRQKSKDELVFSAKKHQTSSLTCFIASSKRVIRLVVQHLGRPIHMMTHYVVQILCAYAAVLFGIMYLLMFNFPTLWREVYHEADGLASLNYISIALGFIAGSQGPIGDAMYRRLSKRYHGEGAPEFRVPVMILSSLVAPCGLLIYAWSGAYHLHWVVPNIGSFLFSASFIACFQVASAYTIETYGRYAASALSTQALARSLTGFCFPLFASPMYRSLGVGWGNTVLACILLIPAVIVPFSLWRYGVPLRRQSEERLLSTVWKK